MSTIDNAATLAILATLPNAKLSRDEKTVVVSYGSNGYLRLVPSYQVEGDEKVPAAEIEGRLSRRDGGTQAELRAAIRELGIRV
jgi:hypothetical protein